MVPFIIIPMPLHTVAAKAGTTLITGVVGAAAYDAARHIVRRTRLRESVIVATAAGLRATRKAEEVAETARLSFGDIVAEARERVGEEARVPGAADTAHTHDH